jgi:hypothetical protein
MKMEKRSGLTRTRVATLVVFLGWCVLVPARVSAQTTPNYQGFNAVIGAANSTTPCATVNKLNLCPSSAFIDAKVFFTTDFCAAVNSALYEAQHYDGLSAPVIDARGIPQPSACASSPWNGTNTITIPSTVLLPAGTISLSATWILPPGTKVVGEGLEITKLSTSAISPVIKMGSSSCSPFPCTGIGIQDLSVIQTNDGIGIDNEYAGDQSYVQRVVITGSSNMTTGLMIGSYAQNSGPYENITVFGSGTAHACAWIGPPASGIPYLGVKVRGLNCMGGSSGAAVELDDSSDAIEDVQISSSYVDGIQVGAAASVSNDVLLNISGGGTNTVHLCGGSGCGSGKVIQDVSLLGIAKGGATYSIEDDVSSSPPLTLPDATVAMYILGEGVPVNSGVTGYTRFTTSTGTATWEVGSSAPTGSSCPKGALFSNTSGDHSTHGDAFSVCTARGWMGVY